MKYAGWIALRYLRNQRAIQSSGIIGLLGLIGITIGVAAVICVASIFLGFRELFESIMLRIDPHVRIVGREGKYLPAADSLANALRSMLPDATVVPVLDGRAVAEHRGAFHVVQIRGADRIAVQRIAPTVIVGRLPRSDAEVLIGAGAAERLGVLPGDTLTLYSPEAMQHAALGLGILSPVIVRVTGLLLTNDRTYDYTLVVTSHTLAARLFECSSSAATSLDVFCADRHSGDRAASLLASALGSRFRVLTWRDLHREMYAVMEWERIASFLLLSLIVLLAVFNIAALLTMTVSSKQRDIAILRTLGASKSFIGRIVQYHGLLVGTVGTVLGAVLGIGLCLGQQQFHWIMLDPDRYIMQELPIALDWTAALAVCAISLGASLLAAQPSARRAMQLSIAESLRFE
ncbi:Lipoprotein-releasing system transmembrane protein LolE [bacterium HR20]|nr:Lipoprotein-releasing system transmembrane protein LolE [bacterium HR20]